MTPPQCSAETERYNNNNTATATATTTTTATTTATTTTLLKLTRLRNNEHPTQGEQQHRSAAPEDCRKPGAQGVWVGD